MTSTAHAVDVYIDCSKTNAVAYDLHNPCQTFVLLERKHATSAGVFLTAEAHALSNSGWRHGAPQPVDYDQGVAMAAGNESWHAPDRGPCAYVATVQAGVLAEVRGLFPGSAPTLARTLRLND